MRLFENRMAAARELASNLAFLRSERPVVVGLANGGVPLADVIARELGAELDVILIEKLAAPNAPNHVVGAVDEHGRISMIQSTARWHHLTSQQMVEPAREKFRVLQRMRGRIRSTLPELDVRGRTVVVVGQGVATGAKMLGAIASLRDRGAAKIVAAAPAGTEKASWQLHDSADAVVIPHRPSRFKGIEHFYQDFSDVSDDMVVAIIDRWVASRPGQDAGERTIAMKLTGTRQQLLSCEIDLPPGAERGSGPYPAVIFIHGWDSDARSRRAVPISKRLAKRGIIGVRMDITGHGRSEPIDEEVTDLQVLEDLNVVIQSAAGLTEVDPSLLGLVGSGSGGRIALHYAAREPMIRALVLRGPICDETDAEAARRARAATLLIHAERDTALRDSIESLDRAFVTTHELLRIPNSSRLFNDPISLEMMVSASVEWLHDHLKAVPSSEDRVAAESTETG